MSRADASGNPDWKVFMYSLIEEVAKTRKMFTSDDVFDLAEKRKGPDTHELRAFGPLMMRAAKSRICRKANVAAVPSRRSSLHASPRTVWESLIHE
jgi:hypothetical protein